MAQKPLRGVGGVLDGLISEPAQPTQQETATPPEMITRAEPAALEVPPAPSARSEKSRPKASPRVATRLGRPPGQKAGEVGEKEKVTLRLSKELADDYREWSWEERCQLGELVEKAMTHYRKQRGRQKSQ